MSLEPYNCLYIIKCMKCFNNLYPQIESSDDFEWTRHLRYSFDDIRDTVMIRQNNSVFEYGFEYLGSTSRLVITPLTGMLTTSKL